MCHLLTRYQSTIFPNHKSCVRKKGVPIMEQTFMRYISPLRATGHRPEAQNRIPRRPQRPGGSEAEAERQGDVVTRN